MMRGPHAFRPGTDEKPKNTNQVVLRLLSLIKPYTREVILSMVLVIISAASQGIGPLLTGQAIDRFIIKADPSGLALIMIVLVVVSAIGAVATRGQVFLMASIGQKLLTDLRQRVFNHIESLSLQYLESKQAGDLMSRLVNDIDTLNNFISQSLSQMIGALFSMVGIGIAMLAVDWKLGLAVLVMVPVLLLVTNYFSRLAKRAFRKTRETIGDVSANIEEQISGVKVAQAFNRTDQNIKEFAERNAANRDANVNANAITSAFNPAMEVLIYIDLAVVAAMGGMMVIQGTASVGVVIAFLQYVQNFFRPIQQVATLWTQAQSAFAAAERVFMLLDTNPDIVDKADAIRLPTINGDVAFKNVTFAYDSEQAVLCNINLSVKEGQTVAIVGPTGAGKSTLVSLLARFYDPSEGHVLIDGYDLKDISQHSIRSQMGIVTQEPFLFSGTIMDNIRYGKLDASDEQVLIAAKAANAHGFIERLPNGYQTEVGERGKLLSQGQRQLIAIARAILADPRIVILDEATASIDTRTEVLIQKALDGLLKKRTSFVIAHRLSTIRDADLVIVIDDGEIVESGTHESLLNQHGLYADLHQKQYSGTPVSLN